jgi:hypothetical protein
MASSAAIAAELIRRAGDDERLRTELARKGKLFRDYNPQMRALHEANADWLNAQLDAGYWPAPAEASPSAIGAFWLIVQHAISRPALMRRVADLATPPADPPTRLRLALLTDRIAVFEGRLQTYGTQLHWDAAGNLSPHPIGDPAGVDERRLAAGLLPLADELVRQRVRAASDGDTPPRIYAAYIKAREAFAVEAGWRD